MRVSFTVNRDGFTLIELLIVMAIFMVVLMISASAFESVIKISSGITKSAQSQMEGIVGLEILRKDLNSAGYGLPWSFQTPPDPAIYLESDMGADNPVTGLSADDFNDARANSTSTLPLLPAIPRAVVLGTVPMTAPNIISGGGSRSNPGSDYLVIKSVAVAFNNSVGKWGYVNYSGNQASNNSYIAKWNSTEDLVADEVVTTHTNTFSGTNQAQHVLAMADTAHFSYKLDSTTKDAAGHFVPPNANYKPSGNLIDPFGVKINNEKMITYALKSFNSDPEIDDPDHTLRMPFNRADYFVRRPTTTMPARCNPGTGILYKTVMVNNMGTDSSGIGGGGGQTLYPLLDCVGDMQVIFDMQDPNDANKTITQDNLTIIKSGIAVDMTAEEIRTYLKAIRVYLLVQEGGKDKDYSYPFTDANNVITVSDNRTPSLGRTFTQTDMVSYFGSEWNKYRWKVYSVVGQPYNLLY